MFRGSKILAKKSNMNALFPQGSEIRHYVVSGVVHE